MSITKKEKTFIIVHFLVFFIPLLGIIYFSFVYFIPKINDLEKKKQDMGFLYEQIQKLKKSGPSFSDFQSFALEKSASAYDKDILKNIDKQFFVKNFQNDSSENFDVFLERKKQEMLAKEVQKIFKERERKIQKILPSYVDGNDGSDDEGVLTDFKFINYVESIFETFQLSYGSSLGITNVVLIDDENSESSKDFLETNLFYIPMTVTVTTNKNTLIDFIHFITNVGKINITQDGKNLEIYTDDFLSRNSNKFILAGDKYSKDYNVYENQMIDISDITLSEYPDSSIVLRKQESLINFLKRTQGFEEISASIKLRFYMKGLPFYKLKGFIEEAITQYDSLNTLINQTLTKNTIQPLKKRELVKIQKYLKEISQDISFMRNSINQADKYEELYKKSQQYKNIFTTQEKFINNE